MPSTNGFKARLQSQARRVPAQIVLVLLNHAVEDDAYEAVLYTLGTAIKKSAQRIDEACRVADENGSTPPDYKEYVIDDETYLIEHLLGAAFVVCQAHITAVIQAARRARKHAITAGVPFPAFGDTDQEVRKFGAEFDEKYSKVEVLWALANYFKHRDEWSKRTWSNPKNNERMTVVVIKAAGLEPSTTGNLRTGAEALGNDEYSNMGVFIDIVRQWSVEVQKKTQEAFGASSAKSGDHSAT